MRPRYYTNSRIGILYKQPIKNRTKKNWKRKENEKEEDDCGSISYVRTHYIMMVGSSFSRIIVLSVLILLGQLSVIVYSEIIELDMIIDASSDEVHFVRGFLQAPASIDLSFVTLITNEEPLFIHGDDEYESYEDNYEGDDEYEDDEFEDGNDDVDDAVDDDAVDDDAVDDDAVDESTTEPVSSPVSSASVPAPVVPKVEKNNDEDNEGKEDVVDPSSEPVIPSGEEEDNNNGSNEEDKNEEGNNNEEPDKNDDETKAEDTPAVDTPPVVDNNDEDNEGKEDVVDPSSEPVIPSGEVEKDNNGSDEGDKSEEENKNNVPDKNDDETEAEDTPAVDTPPAVDTTPVDTEENNNNGSEEQKDPESSENNDNDESKNQDNQVDEKTSENNDQVDEPTPSPTLNNDDDEGGGRAIRVLADETSSINQVMDIVLFLVPSDCKTDIWGTCDWVTLGIGAYDDEMEGGMSYCCAKDLAARGVCTSDSIGTLMIDHSIFKGDHRHADVPSEPLQTFALDDPKFDVEVSGDYVMVIANCNDDGLSIVTLGSMEWKSVGGFLPGDIFGLMFFYAGLAAIYFVVTLWYHCGMKMYQEAAIPIQKYILATMVVGFLEVAFLGIDLFIWNINGLRYPAVAYTALGLGVLKRGSSRCLGVMVAMGWGVVRESLGATLAKIIFLGLLYSGLTLARDFLAIAAESVQHLSQIQEEEELLDLALVLTPIIIVINIIFYCWIISSLSSTTEYLRNMNQTSKLRRHMQLRCLIITSLVIVGLLLALNIVQVFTNYLNQDQMWIMQAVTHVNYLFVLFGVGILWRPNSHAKDYAMQMELPGLGEDENELELSCVVPSAEDMDDENGFKIDDAVAT